MPTTLSSGPSVEPVSLSEAKTHLKIDDNDENSYVQNLIKAARQFCESKTRSAFINQTWLLKLHDRFPANQELIVPLPPLSSVSSITYVDGNGDTKTLDTSSYDVDTDSRPGVIVPSFGNSFPTTRQLRNAVTVTFVAGFGTAGSDVPQPIRQTILLLVSNWYENREAVLVGTISKPMDFAVSALLAEHTYTEFF